MTSNRSVILCNGLISCLAGLTFVAVQAAWAAPDGDQAKASLVPVPPALTLRDVPPIPLESVAAARRYADLEGTRFVTWHPRQRNMIISQRAGDTHQLFLLTAPLAKPRQLTSHSDPVRSAAYEPVNARYLVFSRDQEGNEAHRLYRLDLDGKAEPVLLSDTQLKAEHWSFSADGKHLLYATTTLDRNADKGSAEPLIGRVELVDPLQPEGRRTLQTLPGRRISELRFVNGGKEIEVRASGGGRSTSWRIDLQGQRKGQERRVQTPAPAEPVDDKEELENSAPAAASRWLVESDGEFRRLTLRTEGSNVRERFLTDINWDVERIAAPARPALPVAVVVNEAGVSRLRWFDRETRKLVPGKDTGLGDGVIGALRWHRRAPELALTHASSRSPGDVFSVDAETGQLTRWTRASDTGVDFSGFSKANLIHWKSFDEREISGFHYTPPVRFTGKRPVLISVHGGPSGQSRPGFLGRDNYYLNELGMALIYPNVRGSTGFGKRFTDLDNGRNREDAVKDVGALLDWIRSQPDLDAERVIVTGGSYGGYMAFAIATHYSDRIAGSMSRVGISHFVSLLTNTESYRRDNRRIEYGNERDPETRAFLDRISPLTNAARIKKPLFIAQGRNDPRVPHTEALQMAEKVRANGQPVWLMIGENEGHGFARKENNDYLFFASIAFVKTCLKTSLPDAPIADKTTHNDPASVAKPQRAAP